MLWDDCVFRDGDWNGIAEEVGLFAKEDVKDSFGAGKLFAEVHAYAPVSGDSVLGVEGNGVDT